MKIPYREYKAIITDRAQQLRLSQTAAERVLWNKLRAKRFNGLKFSRQKPILFQAGDTVQFFIADFYCHEFKLIIEVDGDVHEKKEQRERDIMRAGTLEEMGYRIVRFKNEEVIYKIDEALAKLEKLIAGWREEETRR